MEKDANLLDNFKERYFIGSATRNCGVAKLRHEDVEHILKYISHSIVIYWLKNHKVTI